MVREEELERARLVEARTGDLEVEDCAEVVGRDDWSIRPSKGDVWQVLAYGYHKGWLEGTFRESTTLWTVGALLNAELSRADDF